MNEREVALPGRPAPLAGTLALPDGGGRVPGVLIVAETGPTDRNGNQPGLLNDAYRKLAGGLAACGVASLRTDKRGVALSAAAEPDESNLTIEGSVADTRGWLELLAHEPRIGAVALLGHGEGALVASMAAQGRSDVARLALLSGAGRHAGMLMREQLARVDMAPAMRRRSEQMLELLERGETTDEPPKGLGVLMRPSVQPYLVSWFRRDPVAELAATHMPVLIVQGTTDLQVDAADARALARARPGTRLVVIEGMNHVLRLAPADPLANFETYSDTSRPLAPPLVPLLCGFLHG